KWLREMERDGLIERSYRARTTATRAKRRRAVRLIQPSSAGYAGVPPASLAGEPKQTGRARTGRETDAQRRTLDTLRTHKGEMPVNELAEAAHVSDSVLGTLQKRGLVEIFEEDVRRDPLARAELPETERYILTGAQESALLTIQTAIGDRRFAPFLIHGITGSGKTEVYIRAMETALASGGGAMMLVPEIALTPILSRRLRAHFGDEIAIFHSSLSKGERFDEWSRLR